MNWFTTERRQAIQVFLGSLAPLLILFGFGTESTWEQVLIITGAVMVFIAAVLNVVNLKLYEGWAILRGAIYVLAGTASPALVLLGVYDEATNTALMTGLSLGLAALNSLLSIFVSSKQQLTEATANHLSELSAVYPPPSDAGHTPANPGNPV